MVELNYMSDQNSSPSHPIASTQAQQAQHAYGAPNQSHGYPAPSQQQNQMQLAQALGYSYHVAQQQPLHPFGLSSQQVHASQYAVNGNNVAASRSSSGANSSQTSLHSPSVAMHEMGALSWGIDQHGSGGATLVPMIDPSGGSMNGLAMPMQTMPGPMYPYVIYPEMAYSGSPMPQPHQLGYGPIATTPGGGPDFVARQNQWLSALNRDKVALAKTESLLAVERTTVSELRTKLEESTNRASELEKQLATEKDHSINMKRQFNELQAQLQELRVKKAEPSPPVSAVAKTPVLEKPATPVVMPTATSSPTIEKAKDSYANTAAPMPPTTTTVAAATTVNTGNTSSTKSAYSTNDTRQDEFQHRPEQSPYARSDHSSGSSWPKSRPDGESWHKKDPRDPNAPRPQRKTTRNYSKGYNTSFSNAASNQEEMQPKANVANSTVSPSTTSNTPITPASAFTDINNSTTQNKAPYENEYSNAGGRGSRRGFSQGASRGSRKRGSSTTAKGSHHKDVYHTELNTSNYNDRNSHKPRQKVNETIDTLAESKNESKFSRSPDQAISQPTARPQSSSLSQAHMQPPSPPLSLSQGSTKTVVHEELVVDPTDATTLGLRHTNKPQGRGRGSGSGFGRPHRGGRGGGGGGMGGSGVPGYRRKYDSGSQVHAKQID